MAPTPKSTPIRRPLTLKGVERKKPGPAPKPLSEKLKAKALKQIKRVERSYTRERKIEVLLYLLTHRMPDSGPRKTPRRRIGQPQEDCSTQPIVENENGELVWYRAPTYAEASDFWKIPTPTIQGWWDARDKLLEGTGIEVPKVGPGGVPKALEGWKPLSQRSNFRTKEGMQQEELDVTATNSSTNGAPPTPSSSGAPSASFSSAAVPTTPAPIAPSVRIIGRVNPQPHYKPPPPAPRPSAPLAPAPTPQIHPAQNRPVPQAPPVQAPPVPQVNRPAAQPAPQHAPQPGKPGPQPAAHPYPPPAYPQIPPAFNPSNYVVLYTGPHPGPWSYPGQHCIPPGTVLPIVYAGQPVELGPPCFVTVYPGPPSAALTPPAPNGTHNRPPQAPPQPGQHPMPQAPPQPGQAQGPPQAPHPGQQIPHGAHPPPGYHPSHPSHGPPPNAQPPQRLNGVPQPGPYTSPSGYVGPYAPPGFAPANQTGPPPQPPQNTVSQGRSSLRTSGANSGRASKPKSRAQPPPAVPNGVTTQPGPGNQGQVPVTAQGPPPAAGSNSVSVFVPTPAENQAERLLKTGQQDDNNTASNRADNNNVNNQVDNAVPKARQVPISTAGGQDGAVPASSSSQEARDGDLLSPADTDKEEEVPEETMEDATPQEGGTAATTAEDDAAMEEALEHAMEEALQEEAAMLEGSAGVETPGPASSSLNDGSGETPMEIDNDNDNGEQFSSSSSSSSSSPSEGGEEEFETPYETPAAVVVVVKTGEDEDDVMVDTLPEEPPQQLASSEAEVVESEEE